MSTKTSILQKPGTSAAASRVSGTLRGAGRLLKSQVWMWPLLAAGFLGFVGWWVQRSIEVSMQKHYEGHLQALLQADVLALESWFKIVEGHAVERHRDREVRAGAMQLIDVAASNPGLGLDRALLADPYYERVKEAVLAGIKPQGYDDFLLVTSEGKLLVSGDNQMIGYGITGDRKVFFDKVIKGGQLVSRPTPTQRPIIGPDGEPQMNVPVMFVAAPVTNASGEAIAVLSLRMRPEGEFSRIISTARFGETGETYAFNEKAAFLSRSRFEPELKRLGVLPDKPEITAILNLEMRDPGVNLMKGERTTLARSEQPLSSVAQRAIQARPGVDVSGARDYRGVPCIAAWTWLERYNLGLATKVDRDEAFTPLFIVRRFVWMLLGLLALGAAAIYVFMLVLARQRRELQKAALEAKQLGQYTLEQKIGAGGMGTVYRRGIASCGVPPR